MFILDLTNKCRDPGLANILYILKKALGLIQLIGPIVAILGLTIVFIKLMSNPDDKKLKTAIRNWIISFVMLFLLPVLINVFMNFCSDTFKNKFQMAACWNYIDSSANTDQDSTYQNGDSNNDRTHLSDYDYQPSTGKDDDNNTNSNGNGNSSNGTNNNATHTNSINNLTFNLYSQTDPRWSGKEFLTGGTLGQYGCMLTSTAVVSSAYDKSITPATVFDSGHRSSFPRDGINGFAGSKFSCSAGSTSSSSITKALKQGQIVVIMVYGGGAKSTKKGSSKFTGSQHYMALIDISDDKIFVGNGYATYTYGQTGWFSTNEVLTSVKSADYCKVK